MQYTARINWTRNNTSFDAKSFSRDHHVQFGSGPSIDVSSAPEFLGNSTLTNPEELFTASIASCFMLTFLYWSAVKGFIINNYTIEATGKLAKNAEGKMAITEVLLKPGIAFEKDKQPSKEQLDELIKKAHDNCFISCSVKTAVKIEAQTALV